MRRFALLLPALLALLSAACGAARAPVSILADGNVYTLETSRRLPGDLLAEVEVSLGPDDRLLYLGSAVALDQALPEASSYSLLVRRALDLTVAAPDGTRTLRTSALTVGQALEEAGFSLAAYDHLVPPAETPLTAPLTIEYRPAAELIVAVDGSEVTLRTSAATVGEALAEAGLPLIGLDYSVPAEDRPLPADGRVRVVRVIESIALSQKSIPFGTRTELTADLEIDQQQLLQGGEPGLAITRVRTRSEDGLQVAQHNEGESLVRPPQDRILGYGTKIVIRTAVVDGVTIEYWRALNLKATSYSPCRSLAPNDACLYYTSLRTLVRHGEVAMVYSWWLLFAHERIFVPGYGEAIIEDVGGGWPNGNHYWIDLGWGEDEYQPLGYPDGVTVYFLTPVPANVADTYILP
jgi:uncharacterized protein YabE (DUF348 family)